MQSSTTDSNNLSDNIFLHQPVMKYSSRNSQFYESTVKSISNLFDISVNNQQAKEIYLYGINIMQIIPKEENINEFKNKLMKRFKSNQLFITKMNEILYFFYIYNLVMFAKPKKELKEFSYFFKISDNKVELIEEVPEINEEIETNKTKIIKVTFIKRHNIMDLSKNQKELQNKIGNSTIGNSYQVFLNVLMGKFLRAAGYEKDTTTRKIFYYKNELNEDANQIDRNYNLYYYSALKGVCDAYENSNIYYKISLKKIVYYKDRTYLDFYYDMNGNIEEFRKNVLGQKGIKIYSGKSEKIEDVIFENPYNLKFIKRDNKETNVGDYINSLLDVSDQHPIENVIQPIAVRYIDKHGTINKEECQKLYIPMSKLLIVGNAYNIRINQKKLIEGPDISYQKMISVKDEIKEVSKNIKFTEKNILNMVDINLNPVNVTGKLLRKPNIFSKDNLKIDLGREGEFDLKGISPDEDLENGKFYVFLVDLEKNQGKVLCDLLKKAAEGLNIKIQIEPSFFNLSKNSNFQQNLNQNLNYIRNELENQKNLKDNMIFFFLNYSSKQLYPVIKQTIIKSNIKVPSQIVVYDTRKLQNLSKYSNILNQIYGKLSKILYKIDFSQYVNTLVIAYSTTRTEKGLLTSLCLSIDESKMKYIFLDKLDNNQNSAFSSTIGGLIFESINKIWKYQKTPVKNIIIYRDGANDKATQMIKSIELKNVFDGLNRILEKIKTYKSAKQDYSTQKSYFNDVKLCFLIVNKKTDTKFFTNSEIKKNVPVGTLFDTVVTQTKNMTQDFYLCSASSLEGTATCTHYIRIYDDTELSADQIYIFTYYLTYLCINSTKPTKIPAPLYFVNRRNAFIKQCSLEIINDDLKLFNVSL